MKQPSVFIALAAAMFCGNLTTLQAQPKRSAADIATTISPFVEESTVAVLRIDLTRVKLDPTFKRFKDIVNTLFSSDKKAGNGPDMATAMRQIDAAQTLVQMYISALTNAGATEAYAVVTLESLPGTPILVVIPAGDGVDADALTPLLQMVSTQMPVEQKKIGSAIVIGSKEHVARFKPGNDGKLKMGAERTAELTKPFAAAGDAPIQLVVIPPNYVRRAIEETVTSLPRQMGGGSSKVLTQGFKWGAVGVTLPPALKVEATVQSDNPAAAVAFAAMINKVLASLQAESGGKLPDSLVNRLLPVVSDGQVKWLLTDKDVDGMAKDLKPIIDAEFEK